MTREDPSQTESIKISLSALGSIAFFSLVASLVASFYHPAPDRLIRTASVLLIDSTSVDPAPLEFALVYLGCFLLPTGAALLYIACDRWMTSRSSPGPGLILFMEGASAACFLIIVVIALAAPTNTLEKTNLQLYFSRTLLIRHPIYSIGIFVLQTTVMFFWKDIRLSIRPQLQLLLSRMLALLPWALIPWVSLMPCGHFPKDLGHFDAMFYSMVQVAGGTPLLVDGFTNTYGLYPVFLLPIFKAIGLTVFHFDLVMCVLTALSFIFITLFLRKMVENPLIRFLGITSILWSYAMPKILSSNEYFQYVPLRLLFPSLSFFIVGAYLKNPSRTLYLSAFILFSLGVLWSPDAGLTVLLSWLFFLIYGDLQHNGWVWSIQRSLMHVGVLISVFCGTVFISQVGYLYFYKTTASYTMAISGLLVFSRFHVMHLSTPVFHLWNVYVLSCLLGWVICFAAFFHRKINERSRALFYVSVLSVGLLSYYQHRSHPYTFLGVWTYLFLLITLLADRAWSLRRQDRKSFFSTGLLMGMLFWISWGWMSLAMNFASLGPHDNHEFSTPVGRLSPVDMTSLSRDRKDYVYNVDCIRSHTTPREKILIDGFPGYQSLYFNASQTRSAFNPGDMELFFKKDENRRQQILASGQYKLFIRNDLLSQMDKATRDRYTFMEKTETMTYLTPNQPEVKNISIKSTAPSLDLAAQSACPL